MGEEKKKKFTLKGKNLLPKIICFIAALVLWFYVMYAESPNYTGEFTGLSIRLNGIQELETKYGLSAVIGAEQNVSVEVSGKKNIVGALSTDSDEFYSYVDVSGINSEGTFTLEVHVCAPSGVTVKSIDPKSISIHFEKRVSKQVPVKTSISSQSSSLDISLGVITTDFEYVTVTGPEQFIKNVSAAQLNLALGELTTSRTYTDTLVLIDESGKVIDNNHTQIAPERVTATIPVLVKKEIELKPNFQNGYFNAKNSVVTVEPSVMSVMVPVERVSEADTIKLEAIDESKVISDEPIKCRIALPSWASLSESINEATVTVKMKNTATETYTVTLKDIKINNIPEGYSAKLSKTSTVEFTLRGPVGFSSKLSEKDLKFSVDLGSNTVSATLPLKVTVPSELENVYMINTEEHTVPTLSIAVTPNLQ